MSVLVTGGAGYIGSHVVKKLLDKGITPITIDNLSKGKRSLVLGGEFIEGDIKDKELLKEIIKKYNIETVIHLAADSLVGESVENPKKYYNNNFINGLTLLEAMKESGLSDIIFSSTAAVYGNPQEIPITEDHPKEPTNPYGESKLFFEKALESYSVYGINYVSLRYFNAAGADSSGKIGEVHNPETHLIPIVFQKALGLRKELFIFGDDYPTEDGTCIRDYIHVNDLADAHILAIDFLKKNKKSRIYNLGNEKGYSVKEIIKLSEKVTGKKINYKIGKRRSGDPAILVAGSKKIKEELGWAPKHNNPEEIIESAWNWHKNKRT